MEVDLIGVGYNLSVSVSLGVHLVPVKSSFCLFLQVITRHSSTLALFPLQIAWLNYLCTINNNSECQYFVLNDLTWHEISNLKPDKYKHTGIRLKLVEHNKGNKEMECIWVLKHTCICPRLIWLSKISSSNMPVVEILKF